MPTTTAIEENIHRTQIEQLQPLGLLDGSHERICSNHLGEIEQGAGDPCDGNSFETGPIRRVQIPDHMDSDDAAATATPQSRHVDKSTTARSDAPQGRGALVTENGVTSTCEHGCHQPAEVRDARVADRIYASVQAMQSPHTQPVLNAGPAKSELDELLIRYNPVLLSCQLGNLPVTWLTFWADIAHNVGHVCHAAKHRGRLRAELRARAKDS